jgi:hypothetical protein
MAIKSGTFWVTWAKAHAQNSCEIEPLVEPFRAKATAFLAALMVPVMALSFGCRSRPAVPLQQQGATSVPATATATPLAMRVGWMHGSCLAIANQALAGGTPIAVVSLADKASIVDGRVVGRTASDAVCPALKPERRQINESKWSFYELQLPVTVHLGIGVTGESTLVPGGIDLTGDGMPETFTECATSEGVSFRVWSGTPYQGVPIWSGYYYLAYDVETTCPVYHPET